MKTEWDYTALARAYLKRPDYAPEAIDQLLAIARVSHGARVCDVGAGVAHLTLPLLERGLCVVPVEPNDAMRALGSERTARFPDVAWHEGTGEATGQPEGSFDLVTFGSSFNVTDRPRALKETTRILKPGGWFACMWNHRDLEDPLQKEVESIIARHVSEYRYGARREDQTEVIRASGLFTEPVKMKGRIIHEVSAEEWVEAWRSHATLARQAGAVFEKVVTAIRAYLDGIATLRVPYTTVVWAAQAKA